MLHGKNIAIVECEGIIALDLKIVLESYGVKNIWVYSNLVSFTDSLPKKIPHLIIIDSQETIAEEKIKLFAGKFGIPVIYLSDYADESDLYNKIKNVFCLRKPFAKKDFLTLLDKTG